MPPYQLNSHQIAVNPLSCLWWELRHHGFGPLDSLGARVMAAYRENRGSWDFWALRGRVPELSDRPKPEIKEL